MKLAIMQPYIFPYIGYIQLVNAVDKFVIYDDVQFIKEGWIHRNRLLVNREAKQFTLPLQKDSHTALINERMLASDRWKRERQKLLTMIQQSYCKAPCYSDVFALVEGCLPTEEVNLVDLVAHALAVCCTYLGITTELVRSSSLKIGMNLRGQERILAICNALQAEHYINAIGGRDLYRQEAFNRQGILLSFIKTKEITYPQFNNEFIPWLSIIDVMMFNSREKIREYLNMYELVWR